MSAAGEGPAAAPSLREWLAEAPFDLAMSSGFFGFFAHAGMLKALSEQELLPARVAGSSAGALVAGTWAAGVEPEGMGERLFALRREDFWDPRPGLGLLRGRRFEGLLDELLPVARFEECRRELAVSVFDVVSRRTRVITRGSLAPALRASCAVPVLFQPVWIEGRPTLDGGVLDRPGLAGLSGSRRILFHHLSSRSPWRRRGGESMQIPRREGMITVVIDGLPRLSPFHLERGPEAFEQAYRGTKELLERPLVGPVLRARAT